MPLSIRKDAVWYAVASAVILATTVLNGQALLRALHTYPAGGGQDNKFEFPSSLIALSRYPHDARLTFEDTVHYASNDSEDWASLFPAGGGYVRLLPSRRLFGVSMFHQLHCLNRMRFAVLHPPSSDAERAHTQHCLNYVRQMLLCASSVRLEPMKFSTDPEMEIVDGLGLEHSCRDWSVLRRMVEENVKGPGWPHEKT